MTRTDQPALRESLRDLFGRDPDEVTVRRYYVALEDLPLADVQAVCGELLRTWRGSRHPWPADVRALADKRRTQNARRTAATLERRDEYHCAACWDTGWQPTTRDAAHVYGAGVTVPAVRRCACWRSNPVVRANHDSTQLIQRARDTE